MKNKVILILFVFTLSLMARTPKELLLERSSVKMVAEGIEFKPFRDMKAGQIKPLSSTRFTRTMGTQQETITTFKFSELWRRGQVVATYANSGVVVEFHKLNYLPPQGLKLIRGEYVDQDEYNNKVVKPKPGDAAFITNWFKSFTGKDVKLVDKYPKLTFSIKQKWVEMGQQGNKYDFLIQSNDKRLFYMSAKFKVGEAKDIEKAMQYFIKGIRIGRPREVKSSNQSSKVRPLGKVSATYQATVEKVKQQVANTEGWWFAQTKNYILKSNLGSRSKTFAKRIQERVEVMRSVYEKFIPPVTEISAVSVIAVPGTRKEYVEYSGAPSWSAGVWNSARRELVVSQLEGRDKRTAEYQMMNTLHHEAFHQYIFYALNQIQTPAWFNEGHADLFAAVKVSGSSVKITEDGNHLRTLDKFFKSGKVNLQRHINASYQEFYANKDLNYPLAWSVVYFLRKGGAQYKAKGYDKILDKLMKELVTTKSVQKANEKAFYGIDMAAFQKDFLAFWSNRSARSKASRNYIIPR